MLGCFYYTQIQEKGFIFMYIEKAKEQIEKLESLQAKCNVSDVHEFIEIGQNILSLAKTIDKCETIEIQHSKVMVTPLLISGGFISKIVKNVNQNSTK